mgnify:CR=1 FL=1
MLLAPTFHWQGPHMGALFFSMAVSVGCHHAFTYLARSGFLYPVLSRIDRGPFR